MSNINEKDQVTSSALLEQLVYIDNFMSNTTDATPNLDVDGQLSLDLAAFADDLFIFPDAEKPKKDRGDDEDNEVRFIEGFTGGKMVHKNDNGSSGDGNGSIKLEGVHLNGILDKISPSYANSPFNSEAYHQELGNSGNSSGGVVKSETGESINVSELPKVPVPPGAQSSLVAAGLSQNQIDLLAALVAQHQHGKPTSYSPTPLPTQDFVSRSPVRQHNLLSNFHPEGQYSKFNDVNTPNSTSSGSTAVMGSGSSYQFKEDSPPSLSNFNSLLLYKNPSETSGTPDLRTPNTNLDKRRKNTAASARFRIKKKQKEKEMQQTILGLSETSRKMEVKIQQLEMENKLLRNLIVEKGSKRSDDELRQLKQRAQLGNDNHDGLV